MTYSDGPSTGEGVGAIAEALVQREHVSAVGLANLRRYLSAYINARFYFDQADVWDVVDEAITKVVAASHKRPIGGAETLGYFRRTAYNEAVDRLRRPAPIPSDQEQRALADDDIAVMLSATTDAHTVDRLMAALAAEGDGVATRVLNVFLSLAESLRRAPTSREVAAQSGVSHVTVQNVLARCQQRLLARGDPR